MAATRPKTIARLRFLRMMLMTDSLGREFP